MRWGFRNKKTNFIGELSHTTKLRPSMQPATFFADADRELNQQRCHQDAFYHITDTKNVHWKAIMFDYNDMVCKWGAYRVF